eukprot:4586839-Pleurochrysis_carterae.AAC.3
MCIRDRSRPPPPLPRRPFSALLSPTLTNPLYASSLYPIVYPVPSLALLLPQPPSLSLAIVLSLHTLARNAAQLYTAHQPTTRLPK